MEIEIKGESQIQTLEPDHALFQPGEVGAVLELVIRKPDGTERTRSVRKSESFLRQFLELLMVQMGAVAEVGPLQIRDTDGVLQEIASSGDTFACNALTNEDHWGIVVGTGATPPAIDDHCLEARISTGTGAGQLQHGNIAFGLPTNDGTSSHFTVTRDFSNASGAVITVSEIGLIVKAVGALILSNRPPAYYFLVIRDVIAGGISILSGETLTVNYRQQAIA